jgi:hypothetical protein
MSSFDHAFLRSTYFWAPFLVCAVVLTLAFGWELNVLPLPIPSLPRAPATGVDLFFTIILGALIAFDAGLLEWRRQRGSCPIGATSATGVASLLGGLAILCPLCLALPASLFGIGTFFVFLSPFLPLLRVVAFILAFVSLVLLWPRK